MPKADIVLITFPDLSGSKLRPAVILAETNLDLTCMFYNNTNPVAGTIRRFIKSTFH